MDEREYLDVRRRIEDEFARDVDALDRVWRLTNPSVDPPVLLPAGKEKSRSGRGEIMGAVREILRTMPQNFTWKNIRAQLNESRPDLRANRTTVSQVLRKLCDLREVSELSEGRGTRPAVYFLPVSGLATPEQIEQLKALCKEAEMTVPEFKMRFFVPPYEKAGDMPKDIAAQVIVAARSYLDSMSKASAESQH